MDVTPLILSGSNIINNYGKNYFTINNIKYQTNIVITPNYLDIWSINIEELYDSANFQNLYDLISKAEILIIGLGPYYYKTNLNFLRKKIKHILADINSNLSIELMNTGAACRTYNILLSESRKILACLIPVEE